MYVFALIFSLFQIQPAILKNIYPPPPDINIIDIMSSKYSFEFCNDACKMLKYLNSPLEPVKVFGIVNLGLRNNQPKIWISIEDIQIIPDMRIKTFDHVYPFNYKIERLYFITIVKQF